MNASNNTRLTSHATQRMALLIGTYLALMVPGCSFLGQHAKTSAPVTVPAVIQMSKAGVPAETIIAKMRESGTAYRLTAAQIANLHEQGVADAVLDYMQQTYLDAVRHDQALEDWNRWAWAGDGYWYGGWSYGWPWWSSAGEGGEEHEARAFSYDHQEHGDPLERHERAEGHVGKR